MRGLVDGGEVMPLVGVPLSPRTVVLWEEDGCAS
jgi:hypothetical protein